MYNSYNPEPARLESSLEIFKNFLVAEKISKGSVRSYLSDVRYFFKWLVEFLEKNHIELDGFTRIPSRFTQISVNQLEISDNLSWLLKQVNQRVLEAYRNDQLATNTPTKTINRRFSASRKFGSFCQAQSWLKVNPFDVLRNIPEEEKPFPENEYHLEKFKVHLWKNKASKATIKNYLNDVKQFILWKSKNI